MDCEKIQAAEISRLHNILDTVLLGDDDDAKRAVAFILDSAVKPKNPVNSHS